MLVVDDSAVVRSVVRLQLQAAGYSVLEAANGQAALEVVAAGGISLVLLDVEMPVLDGFTTIAALKADPSTADLPVIFLTARVDSQDVVEALRLGAHDYLSKPLKQAELLARVRAAVQVTELRRELQRRTEELDQQARTDYLTGLYNRRHLEEHLRQLLSPRRRDGNAVAVLLVDIDHFKQVNDTIGHQAGDLVLQEVARRMGSVVRVADVLGRWGGEEFLLLAPETGLEAARVLAERLRRAVSDEPVRTASGPVPITVSIGGATVHGPSREDRMEEVLRVADTNLYAAKHAGRDRAQICPLG